MLWGGGAAVEDNQNGYVDMYRLYNPNSGEHFYTANPAEKNNLVSLGWRYEGIGWTAPIKSNTPVYRLYNPNSGDHHYTVNIGERNHLIEVGWNYEGIGWYSDDAKGVPLYRQYNPNETIGTHNYTTSEAENNMLVEVGWRAEGIGWYGVKRQSADKPNTTDKPSDTQNPNTEPSTVHTHSWSPVKEDFEFIDQYDEYWNVYDDGFTCKLGEAINDNEHGGCYLDVHTIYVDKITQYQICSCGEKKIIKSYIKYTDSNTGETWTE